VALDENSTLQDALDQLNANLLWEGSPSKAALALEAVRWLIFNRARGMADGSTRLDYEELKEMEKKLASYVASTDTGRRAAFTRGRMLL